MLENRVLRRIFRSNRDKVTRGWRKLHNQKLHISCTLPNRETRCARYVARMERCEMCTIFCLETPKEGYQSKDLGVDERIILKCISDIGFQGVDWIHIALDMTVGSCEQGNEPSEYTKGVGFLD
jgi:hypothetical protein